MSLNTTGQLINALLAFPKDTPVRGIHVGIQTFAPYVLGVKTMYENPAFEGSRGEIDDNVSHEESKDFPEEVAVIEIGW